MVTISRSSLRRRQLLVQKRAIWLMVKLTGGLFVLGSLSLTIVWERGGFPGRIIRRRPHSLMGMSTPGGGTRKIAIGGYMTIREVGLRHHQRLVFLLDSSEHSTEPIPFDEGPVELVIGRQIEISSKARKRREKLSHSDWYDSFRHSKYQPYAKFTECRPMFDWQTRSFPTCNYLHELGMADLSRNTEHQMFLLGSGFFRNVWGVRDFDDAPLVLKTLKLEHDFDEQNFDRHRMDAVAMERLTASDHVFDIYAFCGQSGFFEYGSSGNINDAIWNKAVGNLNSLQRLVIASQVAQAIADVHGIGEGFPSIVHTDIMTDQFIFVKGIYKLNDFNRCHFMYWNTTSNNGTCPYYYEDYNAWLFRAPEEYANQTLSEKIDIYSMGNVFYTLLQEKWPFKELDQSEGTNAVRSALIEGKRPELDRTLVESDDPAVIALIKAIRMCWVHDWKQRASAMEILDFLLDTLDGLSKTGKA